jgi:integrase
VGSRKLTALKVANAKPDPAKRLEIPDAGKPGLYLVVQPSGRKSWAVRYRCNGTPRKLTLPGFPSLATAHKLAQAALDKVAEGQDPAAEKRIARRTAEAQGSNLVDGAFLLFLERHVRTKKGRPIRETTKRETARLLGYRRDPTNHDAWIQSGNGVLARWKGRTVQSITRADVRDLLTDLVEAGPIAANRTLTALKTCFTWHVKRDALAKSPCDGLDPPSSEGSGRERTLSDTELAALWRAADADAYPFGRMAQLLILTGCRRDEVRKAQWAEFNLPERQWLIPGHRTKNGREHLVPLTDPALAILKAMPRVRGEKAKLLFTTNGETPVSGMAKAKERLHDAMTHALNEEPARWTLHDLRRTFVTGLQRLRFPMEVAEACVNHRSGTMAGVASVYARHAYATEKREAVEAWARHVADVVEGRTTGKVIELRARG